jgi:diadenosine tetraphosphate (Ap4A) HIT family hydrolase
MAPHPTCIFCRIISGEEPCVQLYQNDDTLAFMDKHSANDGHCLVIPKKHFETIFEMPPRDLASVARTAVKIAASVRRGAAARGTEPGPGEWSRRRAVHHARPCARVAKAAGG